MHHTARLPLSSCSPCPPESPNCHPERSEGSRPVPYSPCHPESPSYHPADCVILSEAKDLARPLVTAAPIVYTSTTAPKLCSTARRRRSDSWIPKHPKTSSSVTPTLTSAGPNGSPGTWKRLVTRPCSRPGTSSRAATSSWTWMPPPDTPPTPSPSSPLTISRPSSRPLNGRQRSNATLLETRDGSYPCGCDPATWRDCSD